MKQNLYLFIFVLSIIYINASISLAGLSGFKCYGTTNIQTPIRISSNNEVECFSLDGKQCISNITSDDECREIVNRNIEKVKVVKCSKSDKRSWCKSAKNFFYNKWHCPSETGDHFSTRINRFTGITECLSLDGKICILGKEAERLCIKSQTCLKTKKSIKPSECEKRCKKSFAFFFYTGRWLCKKDSGLNKIIRLGKEGNIECAGKGVNCLDINSNDNCKKIIENTKRLHAINCNKLGNCIKAESLIFVKRINLMGSLRFFNLPKNHYYRKFLKGQDMRKQSKFISLWKELKVKIKVTLLWKLLNSWTRANNVNLVKFWRKTRKYGWKKSVKITSWWKRFDEFTKKKGININKQIKKFCGLVKKYQKLINKFKSKFYRRISTNKKNGRNLGKFTLSKLLDNRNSRLITKNLLTIKKALAKKLLKKFLSKIKEGLKHNKLFKKLQIYTRNKKINTNPFFKTIIKYNFSKALKKSKWFLKFRLNFVRNHKVLVNFKKKLKSLKKKNNKLINLFIFYSKGGRKILYRKFTIENMNKLKQRVKRTEFYKIILKLSLPKKEKNKILKKLFTKGFKGLLNKSKILKRIIHSMRKTKGVKKNNQIIRKFIKKINEAKTILKKLFTKRYNALTRKLIKTELRKRTNLQQKKIINKGFISNSSNRRKNNFKKNISKKIKTYKVIPKENWKEIKNDILKTKIWKILSKWAHRNNFNPNKIVKKLRSNRFKHIINNSSTWKKFIRWSNLKKINIKPSLVKLKRLLKNARKKYKWNNKGRITSGPWIETSELPKRKFKKLITKLRKTTLWKLLIEYYQKKGKNINKLVKKLRNDTFRNIKQTKRFKNFVIWTKINNIPIIKYIKIFEKIVKKVRNTTKKKSKKRVKLNIGKWEKIRKSKKSPSKKILPISVWIKKRKLLEKSRFYRKVKKFAKKNRIDIKHFWEKVRNRSLKSSLKSSPWSINFIKWVRIKGLNLKTMIKRFKLIINKLKKKFGESKLSKMIKKVPTNLWKKLKHEVEDTKLWRLLLTWKYHIKHKMVWKNIHSLGAKTALMKTDWWSKLNEFTNKEKIPLKNLYDTFKQKLQDEIAKLLIMENIKKTPLYIRIETYTNNLKISTKSFWNQTIINGLDSAAKNANWWSEFISRNSNDIESILTDFKKMLNHIKNNFYGKNSKKDFQEKTLNLNNSFSK